MNPGSWRTRHRPSRSGYYRGMGRLELRSSAGMTIVLILLAILMLPLVVVPVPIVAKVIFGLLAALCVFGAVVLAKRRLILDERGVTTKGVFGEKHVEWNDVDHYTFWSMDQHAAYVGGAQGGLIGAVVAVAVVARDQRRQALAAPRATAGSTRAG